MHNRKRKCLRLESVAHNTMVITSRTVAKLRANTWIDHVTSRGETMLRTSASKTADTNMMQAGRGARSAQYQPLSSVSTTRPSTTPTAVQKVETESAATYPNPNETGNLSAPGTGGSGISSMRPNEEQKCEGTRCAPMPTRWKSAKLEAEARPVQNRCRQRQKRPKELCRK